MVLIYIYMSVSVYWPPVGVVCLRVSVCVCVWVGGCVRACVRVRVCDQIKVLAKNHTIC